MRRALVGALVAVAAFVVAPSHAEAQFTFPPLQGFVDVGPGAPKANVDRLDPQRRAVAQSGQFAVMAVELGHEGGFEPNYNAVVQPGEEALSEKIVDAISGQVMAGLQQQQLLQNVRLVSSDLVRLPIGGVGRIVYDYEMQGNPVRAVAYLISKAGASAFVTYTAPRREWPKYEKIFAQHVAGIRPGGKRTVNAR